MKKRTSYTYCVCRIDRKEWKYIAEDLSTRGYTHIKPIIPTISIIRKTKAHKNTCEEIPLLFNYGFIKMSRERAYNRNFLFKLKKEIPGITGWLRDLGGMHEKKIRKRIDNAEDWDDFSKVAVVSKQEVLYYKKIAKQNKIYSLEDITRVQIGDYVTLRGYPFDGIGAEVRDINLSTKKVELTIFPGRDSTINIRVPMDSVMYTIYNNFDEDKLLTSDIDPYQLSETEEDETTSGESLGLFD